MIISVKPKLASKNLYEGRTQQQYEKDIFMDFALRIGISGFKIQQPIPPKPDIIISLFKSGFKNEFIVGCEMKDLYWDNQNAVSLEKKKIEKWKSFSKTLRTELDRHNNGFEYLYGVISLKDFKVLNSAKSINSLSQGIVKLLSQERLPIDKYFENFDNQIDLVNNIKNLRIETYAERGILWWETSLLSGKTSFDSDIFETNILQKHSIEHDFTNCDEKWLLLVAEAENLGNSVSFPQCFIKDPQITSKHKFDRVFYFDYFSECIYQICPEFKIMCEVGKDGGVIRHFSLFKE